MSVKLKIRKNDKVIVVTGRDKGKVGEVLQVMPKENRALVKGINLVTRHQKQTHVNAGGIVSKESSIHISNIALYDEATKTGSKVGYRMDKANTKVRFFKKTGSVVTGA